MGNKQNDDVWAILLSALVAALSAVAGKLFKDGSGGKER